VRWSNRALGLVALTCVCVLAMHGASARAENGAIDMRRAYHVAKLHVGDGQVIENAYILVEGERFISAGTDAPPEGVRTRTIANGVALPGLVDAATSIGLDGAAAESADALTPGVRAADAFDAEHRALREALRGGTTTIGLLPAPANLVAGRAAAASIDADGTATLLSRRGPQVFSFRSPALSANRVPATLAGARAMLTAAFAGRPWRTPTEMDPPVREDALRVLAALSREPVLVHVDTPESAQVAAETLAPRGLRVTLVGLTGAAEDPAGVAGLGLPCIVTGLDAEDAMYVLELPGRLARAGVAVAISSGAPNRPADSLRNALALAVAAGLPEDVAVPSVTNVPARSLGVAHRVGRVAAGLRADLLVMDGEPWEPRSRVLLHLAAGRVVQDAAVRDEAAQAAAAEDAR